MGNAESNLEIGKHYFTSEVNLKKAIPHLKKVRESNWVSDAGIEEATDLLKHAKAKLKRAEWKRQILGERLRGLMGAGAARLVRRAFSK